MKQRVGFARALVVQPEVLFMDEPFSALDVLTAENLRTELQDLWLAKTMPTKAVVMVTHNIDEAVSLADRILVFGANPGHIRVELKGLSPADRSAKSAARARLVELIYRIMTNPDDDAPAIVEQSIQGRTRPIASVRGAKSTAATRARRYQVLPDVSIDDLTGLVQYIGGIGGHAAVQDLSRDLQMRADDLLAIIEATDLLGFGALQERQVVLTPIGSRFADSETDEEKAIFRAQALDHIALLHHIVRDLTAAPTHTLDAEEVIDELEHSFSGEEARRQFETAVDWGRYAELFTYDDSSGELTLDEEHRPAR